MDTTTEFRSTQLQVYLVEDSAPVRERLREMVESIEGARCMGCARPAQAAIEDIRRLRPDAVILDIRLAQGSGFEVLQALQDERPNPAFYVLSSIAVGPYRRLALKLGAAAVLDKAMDLPAIYDLIALHAARHSTSAHQ